MSKNKIIFSFTSINYFLFYRRECKEKEVAPQANDDNMAKWLWAVSDKWTKLKEYPRDENGYVVFS